MLRYIYGDQLKAHEKLVGQMFRDRADQFKVRLNWDVNVDAQGFERDEYDDLNPLYVIWQNADGTHGGSMCFLPTVGRVMVNDHFPHLLGGGSISSPTIWECTRFCLSRGANPKVAAALMLAGGEIMEGFGVEHFVGVFDARMVRIYRRIGSSPEVLGQEGEGRAQISVGLWHFAPEAKALVAQKAGLSPEISWLWFDRAFGSKQCAELAKVG
ncbi:autoinducer synthase [Ascidiaceihabitans sp.]|nr:acyl-homoserine-lactone synthase [Ascidiaceihabitans sp.]MDA9136070.1 autoinducer synthase [Ascidiaceihabitans sp.]